MTLKIKGENREGFPEHGWGIVGEKLGDASTETLGHVVPLDQKNIASDLAGTLDAGRLSGKSWLVTPVNLIHLEDVEGGGVEASYVEASNLTHPGSKNPVF